VVGDPPQKNCVLIAAPHTSNWDFPLMMATAWDVGIQIRWLGKQELFKGPGGPFFRAFGGIEVDRSNPGELTDSLIKMFSSPEQMLLGVPAEGTRSAGEYWKSGFRRIAMSADVMVIPSFIDGSTRTTGFGPEIAMTDDVVADMDRIREFYSNKTGVKPENRTPPVLREETALDDDGPKDPLRP